MSLSVNCWRGGEPIEGERGGESRPFRGRKGKVFPACEPRKGHLGSAEAKGQGCSIMKMRMVRNSFQRAKLVLGNSLLNEDRLALMASTLILNVISSLPFTENLWYALATVKCPFSRTDLFPSFL